MDSSATDLQAKHLAWRKNAQHLYDTLLVFELPWPSLSVEWLPELIRKDQAKSRPGARDTSNPVLNTRQRLVLATNTGGAATEYLRIGELIVPELAQPGSLDHYDAEQGTVGDFQPSFAADLRIVQRIQLNGVAERARYMPQNPNIIATVSSTGEAAIWDISKFPYKPISNYVPTVKLIGHTAEALALSWSPCNEGVLATGDANGEIFIWEMRKGYNSSTGMMDPTRKRNHHLQTAVNDLAWHPKREATLASCGDDGWLHVHLTNSDNAPAVLSHFFGSESPKPTALAWNPVNVSLLAVGFESGQISLMDLRSELPVVIFTIESCSSGGPCHSDYITSLKWNTWHPSVFASASADGTTKVWNAALFEQKPLVTHGGHKSAVTDISWNPAIPGMLASVSEDNGLQIYEPSDTLLGF